VYFFFTKVSLPSGIKEREVWLIRLATSKKAWLSLGQILLLINPGWKILLVNGDHPEKSWSHSFINHVLIFRFGVLVWFGHSTTSSFAGICWRWKKCLFWWL